MTYTQRHVANIDMPRGCSMTFSHTPTYLHIHNERYTDKHSCKQTHTHRQTVDTRSNKIT